MPPCVMTWSSCRPAAPGRAGSDATGMPAGPPRPSGRKERCRTARAGRRPRDGSSTASRSMRPDCRTVAAATDPPRTCWIRSCNERQDTCYASLRMEVSKYCWSWALTWRARVKSPVPRPERGDEGPDRGGPDGDRPPWDPASLVMPRALPPPGRQWGIGTQRECLRSRTPSDQGGPWEKRSAPGPVPRPWPRAPGRGPRTGRGPPSRPGRCGPKTQSVVLDAPIRASTNCRPR